MTLKKRHHKACLQILVNPGFNFEQHLYLLTNNMNVNYAKYSSLITDPNEFNVAHEDYQARHTEGKSVLDATFYWIRMGATVIDVASQLPSSLAPAVSQPCCRTCTTLDGHCFNSGLANASHLISSCTANHSRLSWQHL
jgi:hypothetical protein